MYMYMVYETYFFHIFMFLSYNTPFSKVVYPFYRDLVSKLNAFIVSQVCNHPWPSTITEKRESQIKS